MDLAIKEAIKAASEDEVPVGCVIVKDDVVLAKAHNKKVAKKDATAIVRWSVLRKHLKSWIIGI